MNSIQRLFFENLNLRVFLPLLALALGTTWFGLFWSVDHFGEITGGLRFVDIQPGIAPDTLFEQMRTYSPDAVRFYIGWVIFDYAWPFITFTTMLFITAWLFGFLSDKWRRWFSLLFISAYLTVLMDWGENTGFIALVTGLPEEPLGLAELTIFTHGAKLFFNMVFNVAFWSLLLTVLIVKMRERFSGH
jgi:hypothetical protein